MSDDTKARQTPLIDLLRSVPSDARQMIERGPCHHQNIPYGRLCTEAADAIERLERELDESSSSHRAEYLMRCELERDRDALAERCEKLHEALRDECMYYRHSQWGRHGELGDGCNRCIQSWRSGTKERHAEGCLAAPKDAT